MPLDCLLFFGEEGNGDLFGFRILKGTVNPQVYEWDHENDNRTWSGSCLTDFYRRKLEE